jgi:hypothetical protein
VEQRREYRKEESKGEKETPLLGLAMCSAGKNKEGN